MAQAGLAAVLSSTSRLALRALLAVVPIEFALLHQALAPPLCLGSVVHLRATETEQAR